MSAADPPVERAGPGPAVLFAAFLSVGLSGFGGVLPFARRMLVERRAWMDEASFNETLALCQTLPGPNIVNVSVVVGRRFAGVAGALAAVSGLMAAPMAIVLGLAELYARYGTSGRGHALISGLGAAAAGLVAATGAKMVPPMIRRGGAPAAVLFMVMVFVAVGLIRLPLVWVIAALAPLSVGAVSRTLK